MKFVCIAIALVSIGAGAAAAQDRPYEFIDLTVPFVQAYDQTEGQPMPLRIKAFKTEVAERFPEFYDRERNPGTSQQDYDARIGRAIEGFAPLRESFTSKATSFVALLDPAYVSFSRAFPDMGQVGRVYLVHSLGEMDGGTREFGGENVLIFGADVMGRAHPYADEAPFFHHELFHIYHARRFGGCAEMWCNLWAEGLATYVAKALNPEATNEQLLLTVPEEIPAPVDANMHEAVCAVQARLHSTSNSDRNALFSFARLNERLPPRFGYYIGYLVARDAARQHSIQELARMDQETARPVIEASLARLAHCE